MIEAKSKVNEVYVLWVKKLDEIENLQETINVIFEVEHPLLSKILNWFKK